VDKTLFATPLAQSVGWALIHFIWQGAAIGFATAAALRSLASGRATARYAVACAGLSFLAIAPVATLLFNLGGEPTSASVSLSIEAESRQTPTAPLSSVDGMRVSPLGSWPAPTAQVDSVLPVAVMAWLMGVFLQSTRLAAGCLGVERLKRLSTREVDERISALVLALSHRLGLAQSVRVLESAAVQIPTVVGCLRPVMLLPVSVISGLPVTHLEAVIAHELAHVRRYDYLVNAAQAVIETLLFYHPVVWWCSQQIRIEREHCCDDMVVQVCADRLAYATALANLEQLRQPQPALSLSASGGRLIDRVRRVLTPTPEDGRRSQAWVLVIALAMVLALVASAPALPGIDATSVDAATRAIDATLQRVEPPPAVPQAPQAPAAPRAPGPVGVPGPPASPAASPSAPMPPVPPAPLAASPVAPAPQAPRVAAPARVPGSPAPPSPPAAPAPLATPAPPAPPASPASPAPPAPPENDGGNVVWTDRTQAISLSHRGRITFSDDDSDVVGISPGGHFALVEESRFLPSLLQGMFSYRRLELLPRPDGTIERRFTLRGVERPFDPEGREWLRGLLPRLVRRTAVGAEGRVARILKNEGLASMITEVGRLETDYVRGRYISALSDQMPGMTPVQVADVLRATLAISSDYELARTLMRIDGQQKVAGEAVAAFFTALATVESDYEHARVLTSLAPRAADSVMADGILRSVESVQSDYEARRVLEALTAVQNLSTQTLDGIIRSTTLIGSDYEHASALVSVAQRHALTGALYDVYVSAARQIGSSHEQRRALDAILAQSRQASADQRLPSIVAFLDENAQIEIARLQQELAKQADQLQQLPAQLQQQRAQIRQAVEQVAKLRAQTSPEMDAARAEVRKALIDLRVRTEALHANQLDVAKVREQLEALRKELDAMRTR
jgi:beta-lactamase regulating signal transducer with metallopeptidase domain